MGADFRISIPRKAIFNYRVNNIAIWWFETTKIEATYLRLNIAIWWFETTKIEATSLRLDIANLVV